MNPNKKKGLIGLLVMVVLAIVIIAVGKPLDAFLKKAESSKGGALHDGVYTSKDTEPDESGYYHAVTLTVEKGKITQCVYECTDEKGQKKSQLSLDGKYIMTENGPTWKEQADRLGAFVVTEQGVQNLIMKDDGKTDAVATVSIDVRPFVQHVKACLAMAKGEKSPSGNNSEMKDGIYYSLDSKADKSGYFGFVVAEIKDGAFKKIVYDCKKADGTLKSTLSKEGKYVMTESNPKWHEQVNAVIEYVLENGKLVALNDEGKTDAIAGVSISLTGFEKNLLHIMDQASGKANKDEVPAEYLALLQSESKEPLNAPLKDGTYFAMDTEKDKSGYRGLVILKVEGGKPVAVVYDCENDKGELKSTLSREGKYVMTESNPKWHEQVESVVQYVLKHGEDLPLDEKGKTDAIAGVSISLKGMQKLLTDTVRQAKGELPAVAVPEKYQSLLQSEGALKDGTYFAMDTEKDKSGYRGLVILKVEGGKPVAVVYDCENDKGELKSTLSREGKYVMTESNPKWHEQVESVVQYVLKNGDKLPLDEKGKTDAIAGVSISLKGMQRLLFDTMKQAKGEAPAAAVPEKYQGLLQSEGALKDGTYFAMDTEKDKSGYRGLVILKVEGGKPAAVVYDCENDKGELKSTLSREGKYVMTESNPKWHEQVESVVQYVLKNGDKLPLDEKGKTDAIAGVSISLKGMQKLLFDTMKQAKGEIPAVSVPEKYQGLLQSEGALKDGTYFAMDTEKDKSGYRGLVILKVEGGKPAAVVYDCENDKGELKSTLSREGKYVMTESNPKWHEQVESVVQYVLKNGDKLPLDEKGKTDAIAGVSISLKGMQKLLFDTMKQAKGEIPAVSVPEKYQGLLQSEGALKDGTYFAMDTEKDKSGYRGLVILKVEGGKPAAVVYDCENDKGELKSTLSREGKYVMTESNPKWHEQVESVVQYVLKNGDKLPLDEKGKTDAIAGVSISLKGMQKLLFDTMKQAKGEIPAVSVPEKYQGLLQSEGALKDGTYFAMDTEKDKSGYRGLVILKVEGGKPAAVVYDCENDKGELKSTLSREGKYVMTESNSKWHEQVESVVQYVLKNGDKLPLDEKGKTDAIAGVSISLKGMQKLLFDTMKQAKGEIPAVSAPEKYQSLLK